MKPFSVLKYEIGYRAEGTSVGTNTLNRIGEYMNVFYEDLWRKHYWKSITIIDEPHSIAAAAQTIILPNKLDVVFAISERTNDNILEGYSPHVYTKRYIESITDSDNPLAYTRSGTSPLAVQPAAASKITIVSSSASDTTQSVRIIGYNSNNVLITESLTLTGTTAVTSTNTYKADGIVSLVKNALTTGILTITDASANVLGYISPDDYNNQHIIVKLQAPADAAYTLYVSGKEKFRPLKNNEDIPRFDCGSALMEYAYAEILKPKGKLQESGESRKLAEYLISTVIGEESNQDELKQDTSPEIQEIDEDIPVFNQ